MSRDPNLIELPGPPPLAVQVKRSARARRLALKVSRLDGAVTLTLPQRASMKHALAFLNERRDWLAEALAGLEGPEIVGPGTLLPVEGTALRVTPAALRSARIEDGALLVPQARPAAAALAWLKLRARDRLAERVAFHAARLGRRAGKLTLRDTRSRWGSCTVEGDLMFSWRLIMAPPPILDYVAAHEVAHLAQMNHSPAFWAEVSKLFPDWQTARNWLRSDGAQLHRYRFEA
ncbi:SprT family zinc-dependent metalloprotease [Pararhodobacter sp. CCB-MM2]|uniref:M48 family metallopeptidase n=1 Tax=Pararhodobacter sp. CCB-MM2 TaxID=1786003 RepID=UPI000832A04C